MSYQIRFTSPLYRTLFAAVAALACGVAAASIAPNDPPDLSGPPADLTVGVNPNIFVSFDDSGSMAQTVMGDFAPFEGSTTATWAGPWRCANVVDPDHKVAADAKMRAIAMNGVYYNPNLSYTPPLNEDGTAFTLAIDSSLAAVYVDGVSVGRPFGPAATGGTIGFNNNTDVNGAANDTGRTNLLGLNSTIVSGPSSGATCSGAPGINCVCSGSGSAKVCKSDLRWQCGTGTTTQNTDGRYTAASPMDGLSHTLSDGTVVVYPSNGPYYYRLKTGVTVNLNAFGKPNSSTDLNNLYNAANWEAVPVPVSQYSNFANWYAYYRTRTQLARSSLSRVFGVIGTPQKANIRVTWQNLGFNTNTNWQPAGGTAGGTNAPSVNIVELDDNTPYTGPNAGTGNNTWRQAFFNWIFGVKASNSTPSRNALLRAGNYFMSGAGVANLTNPYYQPASSNSTGRELACRQNFHILMTDGLYNSPVATAPGSYKTSSPQTLPPNPPNISGITAYSPTNPDSLLYAHGGTGWTTDSDGGSSYSDIAFYYWATNLRPDFLTNPLTKNDSVPPYFPDLTTGITSAPGTVNPLNPGATSEVFWNPANDPATWPHLVQFAVTLGAFGDLTFSPNTDCQNGATTSNDDACALRKGVTNSAGIVGWERPNGSGGGINANIDDLWHAALAGRGSFFVATSPQSLVTKLSKILANVVSRSGSSVAQTSNSSILSSGTVAYSGGYNSAGWPGYLYKQALNSTTGAPTGPVLWDAGCFLTGGACTATGANVGAASPNPRVIFTSIGSPGSLTGAPFEWASLGTNETKALNLDPSTTWPDQSTTLVINGGTANGTVDGLGTNRVDYLRGQRKYETTPTPTGSTFRSRLSILGAVINSQAVYEGAPSGGFSDTFPVGTLEQKAAAAGNSYELFVHNNINRNPTLYVGANDGMLHAFDAGTGKESWAYVPNALYANGQLDQLTNATSSLVTSVDDTPVIQDVFINNAWHTILVGGLRLGGRGIYVLDITDPTGGSEGAAAGKFMWEFSSGQDADLGYSYATANIARLANTNVPGGSWVVLVTSGYFPQCLPAGSSSSLCTANGHNAADTAAGATTKAGGPTYLWVLDAATGTQLAKIPTTGATSYGLSTPGVVDFGLDQIDDAVVAGDLAGNLWRFDLTGAISTWASSVDVMFESYSNTSACSTANTSGIGCEPITVLPVAFPDTTGAATVVYVFGTGEYLGATDNNVSSGYPTQHFLGVRDFGTGFKGAKVTDGGSGYPFHESDLDSRTLVQDAAGNRTLPFQPTTPASHARGWQIPLNIPGVIGERDVANPAPLYSAGLAFLTSLIPGQNSDPCQPGRSGALMVVCAATGGPCIPPSGSSSTSAMVGEVVTGVQEVGDPNLLNLIGGGGFVVGGVGTVPPVFNNYLPAWRRSSWNELLNQM